MDIDPKSLLAKYADATQNLKGAFDSAGPLAQILAAKAASGIGGIGAGALNIGSGHAMDSADAAVSAIQRRLNPKPEDISPEARRFIGNASDASSAASSMVPHELTDPFHNVSNSVDTAASLGSKYFGPTMDAMGMPDPGAALHAAKETAPYALFPELSEEKIAAEALPEAANVAKTAYTKHVIPSSELDPALHQGKYSAPDSGISFVAKDEAGNQIAHVSGVKRGDGFTVLRADTLPGHQRQGIFGDLGTTAKDYAHGEGMPIRSDSQVSDSAMGAIKKASPGISANEATQGVMDPHDGSGSISANGRPLFEMAPTEPFEAPQHDPSSYGVEEHAHLNSVLNSIDSTGGATYHPATGDMPQTGYAVSLHKGREKVMGKPSAQDLSDYMSEHDDAFRGDPGAHLGVWHDKEGSGNHFLDVTHVDPDFDSAMAKAKANNQLAIFDLGSKTTIPVGADNQSAAENLAPTESAGGHIEGYAEGGKGGEGGLLMDAFSTLSDIAKAAPEAAPLAEHVAEHGGVTYDPLSGALHSSGAVTIPDASRTVSLDHPPSADEIHDMLLQNQDALGNPEAPGNVLHITSDSQGNHFMKVGQHTPSVSSAPEPEAQLPNTSKALADYGVPGDMVRSMRTAQKGETIPSGQVDKALALREKYNAEPAVTPGPKGTDQKWADFGAKHGVNMTVTPNQEIHPGIHVPGGLEGTFTIPDLFQMKARNFNPNDLPRDTHDALMQKIIRTYSGPRSDVDNFNSLNFGLLSPNSPLLANEFSAQRMRVRTPEDIAAMAASPEDLTTKYGLQSAGAGGMGIRGTAEPNNSKGLAQALIDNPDMLKIGPGETMQDAMLRVANAVPGHSIKTSSLSVPFTDIAHANTSAVDLHMIRNHWQDLMADPTMGQEFTERAASLFKVPPTPEAVKAAYDANPGQGMEVVRSVIESHPTRLSVMKSGAMNPDFPSSLSSLNTTPTKFTTPGKYYQQIVDQVNASRNGLPLFPEQWRLWDTYRQRFEPHEFAHPDWSKLPKQSFGEMQDALQANKNAGYAGKNVPLSNNSGATWKDLYYGHADPALLGLIGAGGLGALAGGAIYGHSR